MNISSGCGKRNAISLSNWTVEYSYYPWNSLPRSYPVVSCLNSIVFSIRSNFRAKGQPSLSLTLSLNLFIYPFIWIYPSTFTNICSSLSLFISLFSPPPLSLFLFLSILPERKLMQARYKLQTIVGGHSDC